MVKDTPPRSLSAVRSLSPHSDLDSQEGGSEDSFVEEASVVNAATVVTFGSGSTRGFTLPEKKQLISDIIDFGGLHSVDAADIIAAKPDYYDNCAATPNRRKKVENVVGYWKRNPHSYSKLLADLGLKEKALGLETPPRNPAPAPKTSSERKPKARRTTRTTVRNSNTSPAVAPAAAPAPPPQVVRRPAPPLFQPQPSPRTMVTAAADYVASLRLRAVAERNVRTANLDYPEQNGGVVTITTVPLVPHDGTLRTLYILSMEADTRYVQSTAFARGLLSI